MLAHLAHLPVTSTVGTVQRLGYPYLSNGRLPDTHFIENSTDSQSCRENLAILGLQGTEVRLAGKPCVALLSGAGTYSAYLHQDAAHPS